MEYPVEQALRQRIVEHFVQVVKDVLLDAEPFPHVVIQGSFPAMSTSDYWSSTFLPAILTSPLPMKNTSRMEKAIVAL